MPAEGPAPAETLSNFYSCFKCPVSPYNVFCRKYVVRIDVFVESKWFFNQIARLGRSAAVEICVSFEGCRSSTKNVIEIVVIPDACAGEVLVFHSAQVLRGIRWGWESGASRVRDLQLDK